MTLLPEDARQRAETLLGHRFDDPSLLLESLTHSSAAADRMSSNERMEFLGDAVLELVVCDQLYREFPDSREGEMTTMKSAVVSRRTCAAIARETGLADLLIVGKGILNRRQIPASLAAAVYESVVAALYLDGGYDVARRYVAATMAPHVDALRESEHAHNYKAMLQQHAQRELGESPQYELLDEKGPDHSKCFEVGVTIGHDRFDGAWGPNKKTAEQKAALVALRELDAMNEEEYAHAVRTIDQLAPTELD